MKRNLFVLIVLVAGILSTACHKGGSVCSPTEPGCGGGSGPLPPTASLIQPRLGGPPTNPSPPSGSSVKPGDTLAIFWTQSNATVVSIFVLDDGRTQWRGCSSGTYPESHPNSINYVLSDDLYNWAHPHLVSVKLLVSNLGTDCDSLISDWRSAPTIIEVATWQF